MKTAKTKNKNSYDRSKVREEREIDSVNPQTAEFKQLEQQRKIEKKKEPPRLCV